MGFVLLPGGNFEKLLAKNEKNRDVILPFLNGQSSNSSHDQTGSRSAIFFRNSDVARSEALH